MWNRNFLSHCLISQLYFLVGGHDSKEDAVACMELVHWKVREEAKLQ